MIGFDNEPINHQLMLHMSMEEMIGGDGAIISDRAKPHHDMTLVDAGTGTLTWGSTVEGAPYLEMAPTLPGASANFVWGEIAAATAADLDFTTEDFTLLSWIYLTNLARVHTIMCYGANAVAGGGGYAMAISAATPARLTFATCQETTLQATLSDANINAATWYLLGATRTGATAKTFINGVNQTDSADTHIDPDSQTEPFHLGVRQTERTAVAIAYDTPMEGRFSRSRALERELDDDDMKYIFDRERHWYGV